MPALDAAILSWLRTHPGRRDGQEVAQGIGHPRPEALAPALGRLAEHGLIAITHVYYGAPPQYSAITSVL